jgi:DNA-binding NarL/FixJ family response regulator
VNESFDEIINLAKENHPNFYTRFQEVYPDFQRKILEINSTLQNSELILLAYIYLNFETKEIADYLFKSPKTIQNRKHNLRKKLQIPSSIDFYVWLRTIEES